MTDTTGFVHPLVHVNRTDRTNDPFCSCHDDPWALCPRWQEWGVTAEEHAEAERKAEEAHAYFRADKARQSLAAELYGADPDCDHVIVDGDNYSGVKCSKCPGWYCA